jgi:hypothetical protein
MSVVSEVVFNASVVVTELLMKTLENASKDLASRAIKECGKRYGFDGETAIVELGLSSLKLIKKKMVKAKVQEKPKEKSKSKPKEEFPLPFEKARVDEMSCEGLAYNGGLFTQCHRNKMSSCSYCKQCQQDADKNASGEPSCGTLSKRMSSGLYEYKDVKGRSPMRYASYLEKKQLSKEKAMEEAKTRGITLSDEHFESEKKESKSKGRPKKQATAVEVVTDMFAQLTAEDATQIEKEVEEILPLEAVAVAVAVEEEKKLPKKAKLSAEEEAAKKLLLEEEKAAEKKKKIAERDQRKEEEKQQKDAARALEKQQKEAARALAKEQKEAEKEAARALEKQQKEAARALAKESKKAEKPKVVTEQASSSSKEMTKEIAEEINVVPVPVVTASNVTINGVKYFKTSDNTLYNLKRDPVGIWNEATNTIDELPDESDDESDGEEEEDEYESDEE